MWVRARPIGIGALCGACDDHRRHNLRYFEIGLKANTPGGRWVVLCHNCVSAAESLSPPARSVEGLKMRIQRDRRWGDRRAAAVGRPSYRDPPSERRADDRRIGLRELFDATDFADEVTIEREPEAELVTDDQLLSIEDMTGIHVRPFPAG